MTTHSPSVTQLIQDLASAEECVRRKALFQLGTVLDVSAIPAVKHVAAEDASPEVKYLARKLLALYEAKKPESKPLIRPGGPTEGLPGNPSAADLAAADPAVRVAALKACAPGKDASWLAAVLARAGYDEARAPREPVPEVRSLIPSALARLGGRAQLANVVAFLADRDPRVRANALAALQSIGDQAAWPSIVRCYQDPDHRVRSGAVAALSTLGKVNILSCCRAMIERAGAKFWEKDSAVHLLATSGLPEAAPLLESLLTDSTPGIAQKALKGLERLAAKGCEPAKEALATAASLEIGAGRPDDFLKLEEMNPAPDRSEPPPPSSGIEREVAVAVYEAKGALDVLIEQIRGESRLPELAGMLKTLGRLGDAAAAPVLGELARHPAEEIRKASIEALGAIATDDALNFVIPALRDASPRIIARALVALKSHSSFDVSIPLGELARHADSAYRITAVLAIGEIADTRFVPLLERLSQDAAEEVSLVANGYLKKLRPAPPVVLAKREPAPVVLAGKTEPAVPPPTAAKPELVVQSAARQATSPVERPALCLEARALNIEVPGRRLLDSVSLTVHGGEFVGLMGPSGAGKSTLMGALNGYTRPSAGQI